MTTPQAEALIATAKAPGVRLVLVAPGIWLAVHAALCDGPSAAPVSDGADTWIVGEAVVAVDDSVTPGDWHVASVRP